MAPPVRLVLEAVAEVPLALLDEYIGAEVGVGVVVCPLLVLDTEVVVVVADEEGAVVVN